MMASGSVVQVGNGIRHIPLPPFASELDLNVGQEQGENDIGAISQFPVTGGFLGNGQLAWRAAGPTVEIIDPRCGTRKAAWTFGAIMHNAGARVTTVCGIGLGSIVQVAIGVDLGADRKTQGMLAVLSLHSSRVTRVFHFTHKVTAITMVTGGEVSIDSGTLAPELRSWHGIIAVGTAHGTLHLLDLALDLGGHKVTSDELSPATLKGFVTPDPQAERNRINAVRQHSHPVMCLSDGMSHGGRFQLVGPDDTVLFETSSHLVTITAVKFIPQLASLVVGYNFGAFQILNLSTLTIDCTSPYESNVPPVHSFAYQEPENDPKNFVYLWLCRSWSASDGFPERHEKQRKDNQSSALCTLYAMNYDNKMWIEGHGLWYQGLASISPRFEFSAMGGLGLKGQASLPSCVFVASTVQQATHNSALASAGSTGVSALATPDEDSGPVPEQSLCFFGWAGGVLEQGAVKIQHYLAVFDINQWYQAQMPSSLKLLESHLCPYMSFHVLDRVPGCSGNGNGSEVILGAAPKPASWARHMTRSCNESDWFPSSLSYDSYVLTSEGLMEYRCQSAQQAALNYLTRCGPSAIVNPEEAYALCLFSGLLGHESAPPPVPGSAMMSDREVLLNVAIDEQLVSFLLQCISEFSEGRFTNLGCSLPSLLEWAWSKVCSIKATNDSLCLPLFDADSGVMSPSSINTLHQNLTSLASLTMVITTIRDQAQTNMITLQGVGELENRVQVVGLLMLHLSVVLWFYHCGLLTHDSGIDDAEEYHHVPFPADILHQIYKDRRMEIKKLSSTLKGNELLLIDGLLEDAVGGASGNIDKTWIREDRDNVASSVGGPYPPPSLHALLDIFLLPSVSTTTKHRIVQYLFLDLASLLSDGYVRVVEELVKYPSSFSLSPSHIKLTQAFWLIDHRDFQEGLNVLLDPLVNTRDITHQQHQRIVKAFLYQGEHARALTYNQIRQPPRMDVDDIRLHLTLLLANGLIREAFHFQRHHRLKDNTQDLLNHLFTGCEQLGKLESIIHLPLSRVEEDSLVAYLQSSRNKAAHDFLLVYYLQRARYEDAAMLQESLHGGANYGIERKRHNARSALIHGYLTHLPDVTKRLTASSILRPPPTRAVYARPQPLSAKIHQAKYSPKSQAGMIEKMMEHNGQAFSRQSSAPFTPFRSRMQRQKTYDYSDEDAVGEISLKRKSMSRDISRVVFPSRISGYQSSYYEDEGEAGLFSPAAKRSRVGENSLLTEDVKKLMDVVLKKNISVVPAVVESPTQNISADLLSLLRTPKVTRKKRLSRVGTDSILIDTPQSILKVKQSIQRPMSPSAASDSSIPVFPRIATTSTKKNTTNDSVHSKVSDTSLTPKQLRFHLPKGKMDFSSISNQSITEAKELEKSAGVLTTLEDLEEVYSQSQNMVNRAVKTRLDLSHQGEMPEENATGGNMEESPALPEDKDHSFMSVDMEEKYERSFEVQEEEESSDNYEEAAEDTMDEAQESEKSIEISLEEEEKALVEECHSRDEASEKLELTSAKSESLESEVNTFARTESSSSSDRVSVLRNPFSGVPSPRQPLPGYDVKGRGAVEKSEDQDDTGELPSHEATANETFYSITEERASVSLLEEEASDGELQGTEKSFEVGGADNEESVCGVNEPDRDVTLCEEMDERPANIDISLQNQTKEKDACINYKNKTAHVVGDEEPQTLASNAEEILKDLGATDMALRAVEFDDTDHRDKEDSFVDNQAIPIGSEEAPPEITPKILEVLNDSECITPLHFSDSESEAEEEKVEMDDSSKVSELNKHKERIIAVLDESFGLKTGAAEDYTALASVGASNEKKSDNESVEKTMEVVSQKEDEMISEALSEEENNLALNLDASEHFSPLEFSDDSDQEDALDQLDTGNAEETGPVSREGVLELIAVDETNVAIAEGAEENSMEANMPEEHSVEVCLPQEKGENEVAPNNAEEPLIPAAEVHEALNEPLEEPAGAEDIAGEHSDAVHLRQDLKDNERGDFVLIDSTLSSEKGGSLVKDKTLDEDSTFVIESKTDDHQDPQSSFVVEGKRDDQLQKESGEVSEEGSTVEKNISELAETEENIPKELKDTEGMEVDGNVVPGHQIDVRTSEELNVLRSEEAPLAEEMEVEESDGTFLRRETEESTAVSSKMNITVTSSANETYPIEQQPTIVEENSSEDAVEKPVSVPSTPTRRSERLSPTKYDSVDNDNQSEEIPSLLTPSKEDSLDLRLSPSGERTPEGSPVPLDKMSPRRSQGESKLSSKSLAGGDTLKEVSTNEDLSVDQESRGVSEQSSKIDSPGSTNSQNLSQDQKMSQEGGNVKDASLDHEVDNSGDNLKKGIPFEAVASTTAESGNVTPIRRSRRLSSSMDTSARSPSVTAKEMLAKVAIEPMIEMGNTTPSRRSRRLSAAGTTTPITPKRGKKLEQENVLQVVSLQDTISGATTSGTAEKPPRSARKISDVPTPLTKVSAATPGASIVTPRRSTRGKPVLDEVNKITQKLLLSPDRDVPLPKLIEGDISAPSSNTSAVLPTPPSSPSVRAKSEVVENTQGSASPRTSTSKSPVRRSNRRRSISIEPEANPEDVKSPLRRSTRRRSISIEPEAKLEDPKSPERRYSRRRSISIEPEAKPEDVKSPPKRSTRRRSISIEPEAKPEDVKSPSRRSTRRRSISIEPEAEPEDPKSPERRSTRRRSISIEPETKPEDVKSPSRRSGRRRSISTEVELKPEELVSPSKSSAKSPIRKSSRRRSLSTEPLDSESETKISERKEDSETSESLSIVSSKEEKMKTPVKEKISAKGTLTPKRSTPSRARKTPRHTQVLALETIREDSEISSKAETGMKLRTPSRGTRSQMSLVNSSEKLAKSTPSQSKSKLVEDKETTPENKVKTPSRRGRRLSVESTSSVNRESSPPLAEEESASGIELRRSTRKRTASSRFSESEDEVFKTSEVTSKSLLKSSKALKKSLASSPMTSVKDSESSEEEEVVKKRTSRRSSRASTVSNFDDVFTAGTLKSRPSLSLSSRTSASTRLSIAHHSRSSLKMLPEDESSLVLTPEKHPKRRSRSTRGGKATDQSILIITESPGSEESGAPTSSKDVSDEEYDHQEDNTDHAEAEFLGSPELDLNLVDETVRGRRRSQGAYLRRITSGKRKSSMLRRSVHSLKMYPESDNQADVEMGDTSKLKQPRRYGRKISHSDTSIIKLCSEKEVEEKDVQIKDTDKARNVAGTSQESSEEIEKESKGEAPPTTEFTFAEPKPIISEKQSRALENLMGEAVEFMFSQPQPQGRIARSHKKVGSSSSEEEKSRSSSESESEHPRRRTSRRKK